MVQVIPWNFLKSLKRSRDFDRCWMWYVSTFVIENTVRLAKFAQHQQHQARTVSPSVVLLSSFPAKCRTTWGRGWMTKASGVGERRKGRGELRRDCHHRVAALFVPTRMQQWYIEIWYITMIYMGEGAGGGPFAGKITWCAWGAPEYVLKQEDSSELTLAFVIMTIIANNDKM